MRRPDRTGYIIDAMLNVIHFNGRPIEVLQVWVDPKRRDSHRDPALRDYLANVAARFGMPAIIRWSSTDGMVLAAPCLTAENAWLELQYSPAGHEPSDGVGGGDVRIPPSGNGP